MLSHRPLGITKLLRNLPDPWIASRDDNRFSHAPSVRCVSHPAAEVRCRSGPEAAVGVLSEPVGIDLKMMTRKSYGPRITEDELSQALGFQNAWIPGFQNHSPSGANGVLALLRLLLPLLSTDPPDVCQQMSPHRDATISATGTTSAATTCSRS